MSDYRPQSFSYLPTVVKNLLIINSLMFISTIVFQNTLQIDLKDWLALYYPGSEHFKIYQVVTHLFMHGNLTHLLSNMFALWMFGSVIENTWGPKKFLIYYMITGLGAALLHTLVNYYELSGLQSAAYAYLSDPNNRNFETFVLNHVPQEFKSSFIQLVNAWNNDPTSLNYKSNSISIVNELMNIKTNIPTVGASGAVFGVLLAFGMLYPNSMLYVFFFFPMKAKYFVILYGLFELYSGIKSNPGDNIAHFAHLGGMLFGFILIKYWKRSFNRWN